jgi:hypothetical protein
MLILAMLRSDSQSLWTLWGSNRGAPLTQVLPLPIGKLHVQMMKPRYNTQQMRYQAKVNDQDRETQGQSVVCDIARLTLTPELY